jgi:hypothetical protein
MTYTPAQQKATMNWRLKNREKWNECMKRYNKTYQDSNKASFKAKCRGYIAYRNECNRLRNIDCLVE